MQMHIERLDEERIRDAVQRAEEQTSVEILPVVVPTSGDYEVATWRGAAVAALFSLFGLLLVHEVFDAWARWLHMPWSTVIVTLVAASGGALLSTHVPAVQRLLTGSTLLDETVYRRAMQFFVEEEVFATRGRTGILFYISLRERRVEIVSDSGINDLVHSDEWNELVERMQEDIQTDVTQGLVDGIDMCGRLLERRGVNVQLDAENQLPDTVRTPDTSDQPGR